MQTNINDNETIFLKLVMYLLEWVKIIGELMYVLRSALNRRSLSFEAGPTAGTARNVFYKTVDYMNHNFPFLLQEWRRLGNKQAANMSKKTPQGDLTDLVNKTANGWRKSQVLSTCTFLNLEKITFRFFVVLVFFLVLANLS